MSGRTALILQARMGSTRLPGKSLMDLAGAPLVSRILERVVRCQNVDDIVLAIPDTPADEPLAGLAEKAGVIAFRGSEDDLVDRYYQAAKSVQADIVLRLPADNVCPEPEEIDRIVKFHKENNFGFSSNLAQVFGSGYPDGIGAEAFDFSSLEYIWENTKDSFMREHVHLSFFNYDKQEPVQPERFKVGSPKCPEDFARPDVILDVNTQAQFNLMSKLYQDLYPQNSEFHITDIIPWWDRNVIPKEE